MSFRLDTQAEPIPGYRLLERLGAGGFGEVWKAEAPGGLLKAIKFVYGDLKSEDGESVVRAEQELKALGRIKAVRHPYILSLERFDIIRGQLVIVMELADRSLWDRFRECRSQHQPGIPRVELLRYLEEAAEALDLMNAEYQLQHLDIKPQNLFLLYNHVKVADFGLVKALASTSASITGGITPVYAAPEMFDGRVSRFCDQYSLGIVYQELLTGQRPFNGSTVHQLILQHLQGKPNLSPLPDGDQPIIARALSLVPEDRFPTCAALVHALGGQVGTATVVDIGNVATPTEPRPPDKPAPSSPPAQPSNSPAVPDSGVSELVATAPSWPEVLGEGDLFPALVVGIGESGRRVLDCLHRALVARFGTLAAVPHIRLVYIDTDPEAIRLAAHPESGGLPPDALLPARLNRASHYLKHKDGRPNLDSWCDPNLVYRIRRTPLTDGLRALGRLAFLDNYRSIADRLREDLQACTAADALAASTVATGLGQRSNRPRAYVVAGLAGGTGSGMFIDLAYLLRSLLASISHHDAETVGFLLLPPVIKRPDYARALGNSFAALTELHHFASPGATFSARYDTREPPLSDNRPPFSRCAILTLPEDAEAQAAAHDTAGQLLYRELSTPLGRCADAERQKRLASADDGVLRISSVGLTRLRWDRQAVLERTGVRLCQQLVKRWMSKDKALVQAHVQALVEERWSQMELASERLIARFQDACTQALGDLPERVLAKITSPFTAAKIGPAGQKPVAEALDQIEQLIGQPSVNSVLSRRGSLEDELQKGAEALAVECGEQLAGLALPLAEDPAFRLIGAEEAVREIATRIDTLLKQHEPLSQELSQKAAAGHERLVTLLDGLGGLSASGRRNAQKLVELAELLQAYPKCRYQSLVLRHVCLGYTSLRGFMSDQLREVSFCRVRLGELLQQLDAMLAEARQNSDGPAQQLLLPPGCADLDAAAERLVQETGPDELTELDRQIQELIEQQFHSLVHVCTTSANLLKNLKQAMRAHCEAFVAARPMDRDVVEMFLSRYSSQDEAVEALTDAIQSAEPALAGLGSSAESQFAILASPISPSAEQLSAVAVKASGTVPMIETASPDDLVIYREETDVLLSDLDHLGPVGRAAYDHLHSAENFTPHSRMDITTWQMVSRSQAE